MAQGYKVATDCKRDNCRFNAHSLRSVGSFALVTRQTTVLSSAFHHAMAPKFSGKWRMEMGTEWLNTRFPISTVYSAKKRKQYNVNHSKWVYENFKIGSETSINYRHKNYNIFLIDYNKNVT